MDKKAIWLIVTIMSLALIGSAALQFYWIKWSIDLNKAQIEVKIQEALQGVADKLVQQEEKETYSQIRGNKIDIQASEKPTSLNGKLINIKSAVKPSSHLEEHLLIVHQYDCDCTDCTREKEKIRAKRMELMELNYLDRKLAQVETRIPGLLLLEELITQEFQSRGVNSEFAYGVYSTTRDCFVIKDGEFKIDATGPQVLVSDQRSSDFDLLNTRYKIPLYPQGTSTPGYLMIHFPYLNSMVWQSAWKALLSALLFTGLILGCFIYSVMTILRQKKVSEMKTDFINNMTHEFKTPIATISLAADSITSPMISGKPEKVNRFADIIKQENKRMLSQVEKVLQMAKFDRQKLNLKLSDLNIHSIIEQAVGNVNLQVAQKNGTVKTLLKAKTPTIQGDQTHISNIIYNLLDNANKYSPKNPMITVSTRNIKNGVEVIVEDNGIGMNKEAKKHIFDKFYRVHTGNLHDVKGFGLGLSYVKALVTAHNGTVNVKSELGKGSSFILFFPFMQSVE